MGSLIEIWKEPLMFNVHEWPVTPLQVCSLRVRSPHTFPTPHPCPFPLSMYPRDMRSRCKCWRCRGWDWRH